MRQDTDARVPDYPITELRRSIPPTTTPRVGDVLNLVVDGDAHIADQVQALVTVVFSDENDGSFTVRTPSGRTRTFTADLVERRSWLFAQATVWSDTELEDIIRRVNRARELSELGFRPTPEAVATTPGAVLEELLVTLRGASLGG